MTPIEKMALKLRQAARRKKFKAVDPGIKQIYLHLLRGGEPTERWAECAPSLLSEGFFLVKLQENYYNINMGLGIPGVRARAQFAPSINVTQFNRANITLKPVGSDTRF